MRVIGREVELVGATLSQLDALEVPGRDICKDVFAHNCYYSGEKIALDVPAFQPRMSLEEGMRDVYLKMKDAGRVPESATGGWEDQAIEKIRRF